MKLRTIPQYDWPSFFGYFSQLHAGALVTMNVASPGFEASKEVVNQPLRGISEDHGAIVVHIGDGEHHPHLGHRVAHAESIVVRETDEGADAAVEIRSSDGDVAIVRFRSPIITELLDPAVE